MTRTAPPENRWHRFLDQPTPLLKQMPSFLALLLAVILTSFVPDIDFSSEPVAFAGIGLIVAVTVVAAVISARGVVPGKWVYIIPMIDIIAFGLFRAGTGGAQSLYGALVLIPVVWLAAAPGIRYVFVIVGLTSFMILLPYIANPPESAADWFRGVVSPLVFATVAGVVNELSRQQRARTRQAEALANERAQALAENQQMVQRLRDGQAEYQALLASFESLWDSITAQAVIAVDADGRITAWNPGAEHLFGRAASEALAGGAITDLFPDRSLRALVDDRECDASSGSVPGSSPETGAHVLFDRVEAGEHVELDIPILTASGSEVPARLTVTRRTGGDGHQHGYLLVVTDETRTVEVVRMKDEFVGMISHELRTPLSSIIGFLDLLRDNPGAPLTAEQLSFVDIIERNAGRLLALVGDLLFTAQVESGRFPLDPVDTDVAALASAAVTSAAPHADRQGVTLVLTVPDHPVQLQADPGRLGQAIDNLLSNAIKFTPAGGEVRVTVTDDSRFADISVRDTGIGIPADEQGQLFTRFFRASTATRNAVQGVGLGLTITRAIVLAHGGQMDVSSAEGEGTEFRIRLPRF